MTLFTKVGKITPKFIWTHKRPTVAKTILSKLSNTGGIIILDFELSYKTIVTKTS
jgi:hypothetical protein